MPRTPSNPRPQIPRASCGSRQSTTTVSQPAAGAPRRLQARASNAGSEPATDDAQTTLTPGGSGLGTAMHPSEEKEPVPPLPCGAGCQNSHAGREPAPPRSGGGSANVMGVLKLVTATGVTTVVPPLLLTLAAETVS